VSPNITLDQWNTFNVDYVFPTTWNTFDANGQVTGTYNTVPQIVNYPSFRIFGGDGSRYLGIAAGTAPAKPLVDVPNPGGYFDNCQISSDDYRGDLHGFVKDDSGNPIEGATVTLTSPFRTEKDVVTTLADGSYTLPTWAPHGYTFSVNAAYGTYTSDGPKDLAVSSTAGQFPQITMTPARTYWDTNGSAPGIGGDGTWYDGCMNFSTNLDGTGGGVAQGSGKVVFGGTVGAVGISGTVSANAGLQFSTTLYTVSGGTLTLGGANAAANTITTDPGVTATITATLGGENGMTKAGTGTLVLGTSTEPVTNGYTGGTIVSAGTLQIGSAGALPAGQALTIAAGATVVLSSGLSAAGANGAATSATAVPEPGTIALLTAGLAGLLVVAWRRGRRR
jgi:autotransporter-associated beta strand protein